MTTLEILPSLDEVLGLPVEQTHVALSVSLAADTETPISLYHQLSGDRPGSFLLESVEGGETIGRYSFIGFDVDKTLAFGAGSREPLRSLSEELSRYRVQPRPDLPPFQGGAVGFVGYDAVRHFERVPLAKGPGLPLPEGAFMLAEELAVLDHLFGRLHLLTHIGLGGDRRASYLAGERRLRELVERLRGAPPAPRPFRRRETATIPYSSNRSAGEFEAAVQRAKEAIAAGEIFQVVLSQRLTVPKAVPPFTLYRSLRGLNPSPYMFYLRFPTYAIVGASPEVLVRLVGRELLVRPIAGTRRRGRNETEDRALERELCADAKELAEHRMLLDLGRNDLGRVAKLGTVRVDRPLHVERFSHVMHLVSDVRAELEDGKTAFDAFRACFPAGTVSGAPKVRAMELIAELEPDRRGVYSGAVGYFDFGGNMDTCIAIRTMVVEPRAVHLQAGAGIVYDSDPGREHEECLAKARGGLVAIGEALAEAGE